MHDEQDLAGTINRRGFLGTGAGAVAVASAVGIGARSGCTDGIPGLASQRCCPSALSAAPASR